MEWKHLFKACCASVVMAFAVKFCYDTTFAAWGLNAVSTFGAAIVGFAVYLVAMLVIGGIGEEDMARVPIVGRTFIRVLRRIGVFKAPEEDATEK